MGWIVRIGSGIVSGLIVLSLSLYIAYGADCDTSLLNRSVSNVLYSPDSQTVLINRVGGLFAETWPITGQKPSQLYNFSAVASNPYDDVASQFWNENITFSPDGKRILSKSSGQLWDGETGAPLPLFVSPTDVLYGGSAEFSAEGTTILTRSWHGEVSVWDARTGTLIHKLTPQSTVGCGKDGVCYARASFSPDGKRILTDGGGVYGQLWDTQSGALVHSFGKSEFFSHDGHLLLGSDGNTIQVRDANTFTLLQTITDPSGRLSFDGISPDGTRILTSANNISYSYKLWDVLSGHLIQTFDYHDTGWISSVLGPDSKTLLLINPDGEIKLVDAQTGLLISVLTSNCDIQNTQQCAMLWNPLSLYSPDGSLILTSVQGAEAVQLWDARSGALLHSFPGQEGTAASAAFSPDSQRVVLSTQRDGVQLWDTSSGKLIMTLTQTPGAGVIFSPEGNRLLTGYKDGSLQLWDSHRGTLLSTPSSAHTGRVLSLAFSPDEHFIATSSADTKIWDAQTGVLIRTLSGIGAATFSPDWKYLATGTASVNVWDMQTGNLLHSLAICGCRVFTLRFSADGKLIEAFTGREVRVWDVVSGSLLHTIGDLTSPLRDAVLSADGKYIGLLDQNDTVSVWEAASGKLLNRFIDASKFVLADNAILITGSDHVVSVWDIQTGALLRRLNGHISTSWDTRQKVSPDNRALFSNNGDGTIDLWDLQAGMLRFTLTTGMSQTNAVFAPNSETVVTFAGGPDTSSPKAELWDVRSGTLLHTFCPLS